MFGKSLVSALRSGVARPAAAPAALLTSARPHVVSGAAPSGSRAFIVPSRKLNVVPVYEQTPRLLPKGKSPLDVQTEKMFARYDPSGAKRAMFAKNNPMCPKAGDVIRVTKKDKSSFVGMLLALNRNRLATTILLRSKISDVRVENRFQIYHPDIEHIEILKVQTVRWPKEKYYFVRNLKKHDAPDLDAFVRRQRRSQMERR